MSVSTKNVVVSGMRPTGELHLGHWHGVLENWVNLQNDPDSERYFFVADYHRLTTKSEDKENIREISRQIVIDWLSCGVDPDRAVLFLQSDVPEHAELHLYLSMITPVGWLERVPSYKDYVASLSQQESASYGFLGYAVLQTADVAIYKGTKVPIGADQAAHLEISREIVRRFNHIFDTQVLCEPQPLFTSSPTLLGVDGRKMSKSYNNGILLSDEGDVLEKKVLKYVTDPQRVKRTDAGDPQKCPVFDFHKIYSKTDEQNEIREGCTQATMGCVDCKRRLIQSMKVRLEPVQSRRRELLKNPKQIDEILHTGSKRAKTTAQETLGRVKEVIGL